MRTKICRRLPARRLSILSSNTEPDVSPRWLPTETLEEIFDLSVANSRMDLNPNSAPLILRNVNRRLRAIAERRQNLWSTMIITPEQFHEHNALVAEQWLMRAGATNLLQIGLIANGVHGHHIRCIMDAIMHTTGQWDYLHLDMSAQWAAYVLNNPAASFSVLKRLELVVDGHVALKPDAPNLREVCLRIRPSIWQPTTTMNLGWQSITFLDINIASSTLNYIWHIMFLSPQLDILRVTASTKPMLSHPPVMLHHRVFSNIRQLRLVVNLRPSFIVHFLHGLTLPRLKYLELVCSDQSTESLLSTLETIIDLRQRCLPPLVRLVAAGKFLSEAQIIYVVQNLKYLEEIVVVHDGFDLVTDTVRELLPHDLASLRRQHVAYSQERVMAKLPWDRI